MWSTILIFSLNIVFFLLVEIFHLFSSYLSAVCACPFITLVSCLFYFGCAGSVGIFLAGRVIYFLCGTPLCGVPGRYNLFDHWAGVDGGTVPVFSSLVLL
jgi:hypothetical protein